MDQARMLELKELSQKISYEFSDLSLLAEALRHSSYAHEHAEQGLGSNERLEFLGDAVLELVVTEMLFQRFPRASEGSLSKARSSMVNEGYLADTARQLELGRYLRLGKGEESQGGRDKSSILADALEAVLAAVYLDGGLARVTRVLDRLLGEQAGRSLEVAPRKDYKTRLQEKVQEVLHLTPRYELLGTEGPDHDKTFHVAVLVNGRRLAQGSGRSKKEAQQNAAKNGLARWEAQADLAD